MVDPRNLFVGSLPDRKQLARWKLPGLLAAGRQFFVISLLSKMFVFDLTNDQYPIRLLHKPNGLYN